MTASSIPLTSPLCAAAHSESVERPILYHGQDVSPQANDVVTSEKQLNWRITVNWDKPNIASTGA
jgi:hypothetical protein